MKHAAYVTLKNGDIKDYKLDAIDRKDAINQVLAIPQKAPVESVCAWPELVSRGMQGSVMTRVASSSFDSAFGALC